MSSVTAVMMDVVTEKSGHAFPPLGVSVCLTPAAPSPLPIPYPVFGQSNEGLEDTPLRTKVNGVNFLTVGAIAKKCHGNEPGTLKEIVSLNTTGPIFPILGAPTVIAELGMMGITLSPGFENRAMSPGMNGSASAAAGAGDTASGTTQDGSKDGQDKKSDENENDAANADDTKSEGATETPPEKKQQDKYCPHEHPGKSTPGTEKKLDELDLRKVDNKEILEKEKDPVVRRQFRLAKYGQPGNNKSGKKQAFWSGRGRHKAGQDGGTVQEDVGGANQMDKEDGGLLGDTEKGKRDGWERKQGTSGIVTKKKLWSTISRKSAENASGKVDAYVVGTAREGNVFSDVELPTLLHNPNVTEIEFKDPNHPKGAAGVTKWVRDAEGCWVGDPTAEVCAGEKNPGFTLDRDLGFVRKPPKTGTDKK